MWNYRVFKTLINDREYYCIKETYYDEQGNVISYTDDTITGYFEDVEHLENVHELILADIKKYKDNIIDLSVEKQEQ